MPPANGNGLSVTVGDKSIAAKGIGAVLVAGFVAIIAAHIYVAKLTVRAFDRQAHDHEILIAQNDRLACLVALSPEERMQLRADPSADAFGKWCPAIKPFPRPNAVR